MCKPCYKIILNAMMIKEMSQDKIDDYLDRSMDIATAVDAGDTDDADMSKETGTTGAIPFVAMHIE